MPDQEQEESRNQEPAPDEEAEDRIALSTGVVLDLLQPSPVLVDNLMRSFSAGEPRVPKVWIKDKERDEENPNDPDYLSAMEAWYAESGMRSIKALLPTGSRIRSKPDDMPGPEDPDFADLMDTMGQELGKSRYSRYTQWVLLFATNPQDLALLGVKLLRRAGVREEDVREAQALFQGLQERIADSRAPAGGGDLNGDTVPGTPTRAGVGG